MGGFLCPFRRNENAVRLRGFSRVAGAVSLSFQSETAPYRAGDAKKALNHCVLGLFVLSILATQLQQ
jgi:hypothetical protein